MKAVVQFFNISIDIDERNEIDTLAKAIALSAHPKKCNICGEDKNLFPYSNKDTENNTYINIKCGNCQAQAKLGQYKSGGYFWHNFEKWQKNS